MKKYSFDKKLKLYGKWWINKNKELNGTLIYEPYSKISLIVCGGYLDDYDPFLTTIIDNGKGVYKKIEPSNEKNTIFGISEDNQLITLSMCFAISGTSNSSGEHKTTYFVHNIVIGCHANNLFDLKVTEIEVKLDGLRNLFTNKSNIKLTNKDDINLTYEYNDVSFKFENKWSNKKSDSYFLSVKSKKIIDFKEIFKKFNEIHRLIIFSLNSYLPIESVHTQSNGNNIYVIFLIDKIEYRKQKQILYIHNISDKLLNKWYEINKDVPNNIKMFSSLIKNENSKRLFIDNKFFNNVSVFENLHNYMNNKKFISMNDNAKKKMRNIVDKISDLKMKLLKDNFEYVPEEITKRIKINLESWELRDRLKNSISRYNDKLKIENVDEVINYIILKRNGIAHAHSDLEIDGDEMYRHVLLLKKLNYMQIAELLEYDFNAERII